MVKKTGSDDNEGKIKKQLEELLELYLNDKCGTWEMQSNGSFIQLKSPQKGISSQEQLIDLVKNK